MRIPTPDVVDYPVHRTLDSAYGDGAALADREATALDWLAAICIGIGAGVTLYLVVAFAS